VPRTKRLAGEERRAAIITAAKEVFAIKGFHAATTRELAQAAGVSEALLFKHFPTKDDLHAAMLQSLIDEEMEGNDFAAIERLEPSTKTLVLLVHYFYTGLLSKPSSSKARIDVLPRLLFQSVMSDGAFARLFLRQVPLRWVSKLEDCIRVATARGEIVVRDTPADLRGWFAHHLAAMILLQNMPDPPTVDYGVPHERLVEHAVRFALRGIGLPDEAIRRHYDPTRLRRSRR
jgi:AcrR family transcriptional regulator